MIYDSPIGSLDLTFDAEALTGLRIMDRQVSSNAQTMLKAPAEAFRWLDLYFAGCNPDFMPPLAPRGTDFQQRVWRVLLSIPYGATITYGELARRVGCRSAQAVGHAVGRNPIAIIIPCHRVVAVGGLGGYAYGIDRKRRLLQWEAYPRGCTPLTGMASSGLSGHECLG